MTAGEICLGWHWHKCTSCLPPHALYCRHSCQLQIYCKQNFSETFYFSLIYPKFCIGFKMRKSRWRTTLRLRFGLLKMVFEYRIAWCDLGLGRAIVHCQRNHLRKTKLSRNRAICQPIFQFYNGFFWIGFFLVLHRLFSTVRCSWRSSVLRGFW